MKVGPTADRVAELARFIETLTERFKANESLFATRLEVSERELALLRALVREGPMITRELGGRFGVPVSTMTGLIDRMEKKGLVRRVRDRRDRRSIELEATPTWRRYDRRRHSLRDGRAIDPRLVSVPLHREGDPQRD